MSLDPNELVSFLAQLKKNNNKAWFEAHREEYQRLRTQFTDVVQDVIVGIAAFDALIHADMKPEETMFRINRDVRFSKDKSPYKTTFSAAISTHGRRGQMPGYYFQISETGELFAAGGLHMPAPDQLRMIRNHLVNRPAEFEALQRNKTFRKTFEAIEGERLVRVPKGFEDDAPHADYLRLKSWTVGRALSVKKGVTVDNDMLPFIVSTFRGMHPLFVWLRAAVGA